LGRDPVLLARLSNETGLNILTNTGLYGARNNKFIPKYAFKETADELAKRWIKEWKHGIEDTNIRPGFIKIAVDRTDTLSLIHQKIVRAAAKTHLKTGLAIVSHTGPEKPAFEQLIILEEEGVAPEAFIWIHAQRGSKEAHVQIAKQDAWISLDNVKDDSARIAKLADMVLNLKNNNLLHRVLVSHDAGWYRVGQPDGGKFRDYTAVFNLFIPVLRENGFTDNDINQLLNINPREAFTIRKRVVN